MYHYIKNELIKTVYVKKLYLGFLAAILFSLIITLFFRQNGHLESGFDLLKSMLIHLYSLNFYLFGLGFAAFIYSLEFEERTIKIIRSKPLSIFNFLIGKYIAGILYTALFYLIFALFTTVLALTLFQMGDFSDYKNGAIISMAEGWKYTIIAYALQAYVSILIIALLYLFAIIFENGVIAFITTFFTILGCSIVGRKYFIHKLLPTRYMEIWRIVYRESIPWDKVALYCGIITALTVGVFIISYLILKRKDVKG